jgi:integrase
VFASTAGEAIDDSRLRRRFYDARAKAGLKETLRFHDLRHTFGGTLAVQAFPLSDVRAYMGHADISTTMIYVHHVPQVDAFSAALATRSAIEELIDGNSRGRAPAAEPRDVSP